MKQLLEFNLADYRSVFVDAEETQTPNDLALECGIPFHANTGAIWASAGLTATVNMLLKWVKKRYT